MKPKKLRVKKSFRPQPADAEDEIYPNGIFEFNITKLITFIKDNPDQFPIEQIEVSSLGSWAFDRLNNETVESANVGNPIVLAEISPGRFNVIDGNHRVEKAHRLGMDRIPAYRVQAEQHIAFLTSVRAYEAYVEYWNGKLDNYVST